jgi:hypothetical protein
LVPLALQPKEHPPSQINKKPPKPQKTIKTDGIFSKMLFYFDKSTNNLAEILDK